ncbi:MAG TPA: hypothetical protein VLE97_11210 [Gaiellaceae bacterium]|nr:hypothetical protein [Gaiellaceae bacterium]
MPKKSSAQLDREIAEALGRTRSASARKKKGKSREENRTARLLALRGIMADVMGDAGWLETDPNDLDKWISVEDDVTDRQWFDAAKDQLVEQSVAPEHAGAPPPNVRAWNDVFISTYRMNIDDGMSEEDAIDSARQNAHDTVTLESSEHGLERTDPKLYGKRW